MPGTGLPFARRMFAIMLSWISWMRRPAECPARVNAHTHQPEGKLTFVPQRRPSPAAAAYFRNLVLESKSPARSALIHVQGNVSTARRSSACVLALSSLCASQRQRRLFLCGLLPRGHLSCPPTAPSGLPGLPRAAPVHSEGQGRSVRPPSLVELL